MKSGVLKGKNRKNEPRKNSEKFLIIFLIFRVLMSAYREDIVECNVHIHVCVSGGASLASLRSALSAPVCIVEFMVTF